MPTVRSPRRLTLLAALLLAFGLEGAVSSARAADGRGLVVAELFTSQGCSSCPPADALLGELAEREDVIALSLHVDYWDYIGWRDPFASPEVTARQRRYARHLGAPTVYTPQMVIDGRAEVIGSRRSEVLAALEEAATRPKPIVLDLTQERVLVPAGAAPPEGAELWLVGFDLRQDSEILRGENAGRRLAYHNVARSWRQLALWRGKALELALDLGPERAAGRSGVVLLLQGADGGPILAAARRLFE